MDLVEAVLCRKEIFYNENFSKKDEYISVNILSCSNHGVKYTINNNSTEQVNEIYYAEYSTGRVLFFILKDTTKVVE